MSTWKIVGLAVAVGGLIACGGGESGGPAPGSSAVKEMPGKGLASADGAKPVPAASATTTATVAAIVTSTASASAAASAAPAASGSAKPGEATYQANGFPTEMPKAGEKTAIPKIEEWVKAPVISTKKLPDGCSMKLVREWMNIKCEKNATTGAPKKITLINGLGTEGTDLFKLEKEGQMIDLVFRTVREKKGNAIFVTDKKSYKVGYDWPAGAPFPSTIFE